MHVSASQIGSALACWRLWAYSRTEPRGPGTPESAFGTEAHDQLERWHRFGEPPSATTPVGRCALAALPHVPVPGEAVPEHEWHLEFEGVEYTGRVDVLSNYQPGQSVQITDYKTKGDLRYAMSPDELAWDPQRILYAWWAVADLGVLETTCQWLYLRRKNDGTQAQPVRYRELAQQTVARFLELHRRVGLPIWQAYHILAEHGVEAFPRNLKACYRFGPRRPCEHLEKCMAGLTLAQRATLPIK